MKNKIEFPHTEESYAGTLTTNNIPTSEMLFTINAEAMQGNINLPYYVMAHELTHEWFGNQMKPANMTGAKMLTESITEYITLYIYRKNLGDDIAKKFLATQFDRYQRGKKKEKAEEPPLFQVASHQQYIAYGKGAIALDQISKAIGDENMEHCLKTFLDEFGQNKTNYPSTLYFINFLKREVDTIHYPVIDHWLMKVHDFELEDIKR